MQYIHGAQWYGETFVYVQVVISMLHSVSVRHVAHDYVCFHHESHEWYMYIGVHNSNPQNPLSVMYIDVNSWQLCSLSSLN